MKCTVLPRLSGAVSVLCSSSGRGRESIRQSTTWGITTQHHCFAGTCSLPWEFYRFIPWMKGMKRVEVRLGRGAFSLRAWPPSLIPFIFFCWRPGDVECGLSGEFGGGGRGLGCAGDAARNRNVAVNSSAFEHAESRSPTSSSLISLPAYTKNRWCWERWSRARLSSPNHHICPSEADIYF